MRRTHRQVIGVFLITSSLVFSLRGLHAADEGPGGPPFPNDTGPDTVDVSKYPEDVQAGYRVFARRCSQCHSLSRPINSENVQLTAEEIKAAKEKQPELFKNPLIWRVSESVWTDYVRKMQGKPGAIIRESEFPKIVGFLVYDSKVRKTGDNAAAWKAQRQKLLDDFKTSHSQRYQDLFGK
jgi:hypothetical protein